MSVAPDGDQAFPLHHVRPSSGWVNDPNGPIHWNGRYHLFFQHNPNAPVHSEICWGHASSADLVRWNIEPVALVPRPGGPDAGGCWSGCIVNDSGVATAIYTAATEGSASASICLATSSDNDLRSWRQDDTPVAEPPAELALLGFRDPFVFTHSGHRYAAVGAGLPPSGRPTVLLYGCDDLQEWTFLGTLLDTTDAIAAELAPADIWECPQLFELGGRWVLIVSLAGERLGRVAYLLGDLVTTDGALRFVPSSGGLVDHGHDVYAPAVLAAADRTLLWGWTWEDRSEDEVLRAGWAGALTMARELTLSADQRVLSSPVAETALLHRAHARQTLTAQSPHLVLPSGPVDLLIHAYATQDSVVSLELFGTMRLELDVAAGTAELVKDVHDAARRRWITRAPFLSSRTSTDVRIIIDGSIVELFVEDGPTFTERVYPKSPPGLLMRGNNSARCEVVVRSLVHPERTSPQGAGTVEESADP